MCFGMISQTGAVRNDSGYINVADRAAAFYRGGDLAFTDVAGDAWYADAVRWASAEGVLAGYADGRFGPEDVVTREQLAVILHAMAGKPAAEGQLNFADAGQISDWAVDAVRWAVANGMMVGVGGNRIAPADSATRAEGAVVLMQYMRHSK